jgi:phosphoribosylformylglycinamidine cyclo-ligase
MSELSPLQNTSTSITSNASNQSQGLTYASSGVDITAGAEAVNRIKKAVKETYSKDVLTSLGSFGSAMSLKSILNEFEDPILVQSTDGVGTKLIIAKMMNKFEGVGKDVVSNNVNDMLCMGARPITFLDYIGCSKLSPEQMETIVTGMANECKEHGISLVGGEMAEMPGVYVDGEVDVVGFVTGVVERNKIITGENIKEGDLVLGLASSGLHTNGFSLARKALFDIAGLSPSDNFGEVCSKYEVNTGEFEDKRLGDILLEAHRNYTKPILDIMDSEVVIKGLSHITGGGFIENIPRILPKNLGVEIQKSSYPVLPIFNLIQKVANIEEREMYRTLNMGIGMIVIIDPRDKDLVFETLKNIADQEIYTLGVVTNLEGVKLV